MIEVVYDAQKHAVTMSGHALAGLPGHDLVCASVSSLLCTLALNVGYMQEDGLVKSVVMDIEEGNATVSCVPTEGNEGIVTVVFATIWHGLAQLALEYPENISFKLLGQGVEIPK